MMKKEVEWYTHAIWPKWRSEKKGRIHLEDSAVRSADDIDFVLQIGIENFFSKTRECYRSEKRVISTFKLLQVVLCRVSLICYWRFFLRDDVPNIIYFVRHDDEWAKMQTMEWRLQLIWYCVDATCDHIKSARISTHTHSWQNIISNIHWQNQLQHWKDEAISGFALEPCYSNQTIDTNEPFGLEKPIRLSYA